MIDEKRQPAIWRSGLVWTLATLAAGLCLALAGCTDQPAPTTAEALQHNTSSPDAPLTARQPTPTPFTPFGGSHDTLLMPTPTPFTPFGGSHDTLGMPAPVFYGAAAAPLEKRIYVSDVIVRAKLLSVEAEDLVDLLGRSAQGAKIELPPKVTYHFQALEYLKGTGPSEITVVASALERNEDWEKGEALLFLNAGASAGETEPGGSDSAARQGADPPTQTYVFTSSYSLYDDAFTIESVNPGWLPATSPPQADSSSSGDGLPTAGSFATEWDHDTGQPTDFMSLPEIKGAIAWVKGDGTAEYDRCVGQAINYMVWNRDWEAYYGAPKAPGHHKVEIASGKGTGITITEGSEISSNQYHRFWLTGEDAELFQAIDVDGDTDPANGYKKVVITARPLPAGQYTFSDHSILPWYDPCDFDGEGQLNWTVTAMGPVGTLYEAFFDPAAIGQGVGANSSNGILQPTAITAEGYATEIKSLVWQNGSVTLTLSPYVSLLGQTLDFIAQDGTIALSLPVKSATVNDAAGTLTWTQATRPWSADDRFMLRLRGPAIAINDASGTEGAEVKFQVTLSEAANHEVRVSWKVMEGGEGQHAYRHRNEFWGMSGELVFRPGQTSQTGRVLLGQDTYQEEDEVFLVVLSAPKGATIADGEGLMTIIDDG